MEFQTLNEDIITTSLLEKCPNMEIFLVRIFLYSVQVQKNTEQKKPCIWTLFTQCMTKRCLYELCDMLRTWSQKKLMTERCSDCRQRSIMENCKWFQSFTCINFSYIYNSFVCSYNFSWTAAYKIAKARCKSKNCFAKF